MRRKILVLLLCFALLFCLTACGAAEPSKSESTSKPDRTYVYDPADYEGLSDKRLVTEPPNDLLSGWYPADDSDQSLQQTASLVLTYLSPMMVEPITPAWVAVNWTPSIDEEISLTQHVIGMAMRKNAVPTGNEVWYLDDVQETYRFLFGENAKLPIGEAYNLLMLEQPAPGLVFEMGMTAGSRSSLMLVTEWTVDGDTLAVTARRSPDTTLDTTAELDDLLARYEADPDAVLEETKDWETVDYTFTIADDGHLVLEL